MAFGLISTSTDSFYLRYVMLFSETRWRELVVDCIVEVVACFERKSVLYVHIYLLLFVRALQKNNSGAPR